MMRGRRISSGSYLAAVLIVASAAIPSLAAEGGGKADDEGVFVEKSMYGPVQKRIFTNNHELSLGWAYLPLDAYYKGYGVQVAYTIHFDDIFALELFRIGWSYNRDTKLKTRLIEQMPDVSPTEFPAIVLFENTDFIMKFLYGKESLLNSAVVHYELFAAVGVSLLYLNPDNMTGDFESDLSELQFGVNAGLGFRVWFNPTWSLKVDIRDTLSLLSFTSDEFPLKNSALLGVSIAVDM